MDEVPGTLHAVAKWISVVFSAGNEGPAPQSAKNNVPWVITVAASTMDRSFPTVIMLGNHQKFVGQSVFYESKIPNNNSFTELVNGRRWDTSTTVGDFDGHSRRVLSCAFFFVCIWELVLVA